MPLTKLSPSLTDPTVMDCAELVSRSRAASRLAMRGNAYDTEDRMDCAASIVAAILMDLPAPDSPGAVDYRAPVGP